MKVSDLILLAAKDIGVVSKTQPLSADEQFDAFLILNMMLDSWQAERLLIYENRRSVYPLVAGQQAYTIGVGGNFNAARPLWIQDAGLVNTAYTPNFELPIRILTIDEWASVTLKGQAATQSWYLYNDYAYPLSTLSFWPVPGAGTLSVALYVPTAISQFATVNDLVAFPPGYAEALRFNLAVRLCPSFGRQVDPVIGGLAVESLARIQRSNKRLDTLGVDNALIGEGGHSVFNWISGQSTGLRNS